MWCLGVERLDVGGGPATYKMLPHPSNGEGLLRVEQDQSGAE